jgi:hypothetical protein
MSENERKGPVVAFLSAVVGAFVAGVTGWIFLVQHVDDQIKDAVPRIVKTMFDNGTIKLPSPSPGPPGPPGPAFDLKTTVIRPTVHLRFLDKEPPDSVGDINLIRETDQAEKVITIPELAGRRIIGLSWMPVLNMPAVIHFGTVQFQPYEENKIKISAALAGTGASSVGFEVTIFHVPAGTAR